MGQLKQRFFDATFFLETDDPRPAPLRISMRRPPESNDIFYVGKNAGGKPQFQAFDVARGGGDKTNSAIFELLRDDTVYRHDVFACNGLDAGSSLGGELDQCKLSNLDPASRAFLIDRSLIGDLEITIKKQELGTRVPKRFFSYLRYQYDIPTPP